ncbi:MAG: hypothetical protein SV760_07065, partial [Halobacteria archaeon]|nr:hypothetical protein [Halobacteria archaeon]
MKRSRVDWSYRLRVRNLAVTAALGIGGWLAYELVYGFVPGIVGLGSRGPFQGTDALFSQGLLYIGVI